MSFKLVEMVIMCFDIAVSSRDARIYARTVRAFNIVFVVVNVFEIMIMSVVFGFKLFNEWVMLIGLMLVKNWSWCFRVSLAVFGFVRNDVCTKSGSRKDLLILIVMIFFNGLFVFLIYFLLCMCLEKFLILFKMLCMFGITFFSSTLIILFFGVRVATCKIVWFFVELIVFLLNIVLIFFFIFVVCVRLYNFVIVLCVICCFVKS